MIQYATIKIAMYNIKKHINMHITKSTAAWYSVEKKPKGKERIHTYNYIVIAHQDKHCIRTYIVLLAPW